MFFRSLFISFASLFFILMAFNVHENVERKRKINVILITVESLRNDMVTHENCPHLLQVAAKGLRFSNYRANSAWTGTNIVSLLSGLSPFESGVHTRGQSVDPETFLPLEQLVELGYTVKGLQPFMAMDIYQNLGVSLDSYSPDPLLWLARQQLDENPFFLWYHYVHTHLPYTNSDADKDSTYLGLSPQLLAITRDTAIHAEESRFQKEDIDLIHKLQQANIQEFDRWFNTLYEFYTSGGFSRDTILIVTADHGDEHGERGMVGHASTTLEGHLHEEIVHVPFFIWLPESHQSVEVDDMDLDRPVSHVDVMPTLMHLLDIRPEYKLQGENFLSRIDKDRIWTAMTSSGGFAEPDPAAIRYFEYSLLENNWKIRFRQYSTGLAEELYLYDLSSDPDEENNLAGQHPDRARVLQKRLEEQITTRKFLPVRAGDSAVNTGVDIPKWVYPSHSNQFTYDSLDGRFYLEWSGATERSYLLEYKAGHGAKVIQGSLQVDGNRKDFGNISQVYWNTWIVPNNPFSIRVKEVGGDFGPWLELEALP
jgi:arylsulfatase A-like enzyme